jgi:hypothetical protein
MINYSTAQSIKTDTLAPTSKKFNYKPLIIPAGLITYGFIGLDNGQLDAFNKDLRYELKEHIDSKFTIDDISQYTPMATVYALNAMNIEGKNNFIDRTITIATAYIIMGITVNSLKQIAKIERPDGTSNNSFPSGHTATAFMGAEFLHQEYKDVSIWYSISGYTIASATGLFRVYNNRHWLTDVAAGAGIGILSTKAAYLLQPYLKRKLFKNKKDVSGIIFPFYSKDSYGLQIAFQL